MQIKENLNIAKLFLIQPRKQTQKRITDHQKKNEKNQIPIILSQKQLTLSNSTILHIPTQKNKTLLSQKVKFAYYTRLILTTEVKNSNTPKSKITKTEKEGLSNYKEAGLQLHKKIHITKFHTRCKITLSCNDNSNTAAPSHHNKATDQFHLKNETANYNYITQLNENQLQITIAKVQPPTIYRTSPPSNNTIETLKEHNSPHRNDTI